VTREETPTRVLIVGFGNPLMADDEAGTEVVRRLAAQPLPTGVRVEDGGTDSLRLPGLWCGEAQVWLVDAVAGGGGPGSIIRLGHEEVLVLPQPHATAHALSLPEALRWISLSYPEMAAVRYRLWGIVAVDLSPHVGLSPAVGAAVERVVEEIVHELGTGNKGKR
jgi:hydrogenase maturation protease